MDTQAKDILNELEARGWQLVKKEKPESPSYWWVWEFWTIRKEENQLFLNFLIDPQGEKKKENVWIVTASNKEPIDRFEAEQGISLTIGRNWKDRLSEFVNSIEQPNRF